MKIEQLILWAFVAGMALLAVSIVYQGAIVLAEDMFSADSFSAKWITNEHYEGE